MAVSIGVDETADQCFGMSIHHLPLPWLQLDCALMLSAPTMLGEDGNPVLPEGRDLDTARPGSESDDLISLMTIWAAISLMMLG